MFGVCELGQLPLIVVAVFDRERGQVSLAIARAVFDLAEAANQPSASTGTH